MIIKLCWFVLFIQALIFFHEFRQSGEIDYRDLLMHYPEYQRLGFWKKIWIRLKCESTESIVESIPKEWKPDDC